MGKTIKRYHYVPMLDDANINDQGIDANGYIGDGTDSTPDAGNVQITITATPPGGSGVTLANPGLYTETYFVGEGETDALALADAQAQQTVWFAQMGFIDEAAAITAGWGFTTSATVPYGGNLYGSSKDVGSISSKLPSIAENGGAVNRVGFSRIELEGSIEKYGFYESYTKESVDFDTDSELRMHIYEEMVKAANEITEDTLQIDLLNSAGVVYYGGEATATGEVTGESGAESLVTYEDLMKLSIQLDNNRCPKNTKIITGSRMTDTKVVDAARYIYIGSELIPMVKRMTDLFGNQAFIPVQQYAAAGTIATGEIGTVDQFRIIVVPEMMHWESAGATVTTNAGYRETGGNYDVFPMLVIGSGSFTTIGFQTDGKTVKFKIKHVAPESASAYSLDNPFGELGFQSIKWYYGFMLLRPERIALVKTVAEY